MNTNYMLYIKCVCGASSCNVYREYQSIHTPTEQAHRKLSMYAHTHVNHAQTLEKKSYCICELCCLPQLMLRISRILEADSMSNYLRSTFDPVLPGELPLLWHEPSCVWEKTKVEIHKLTIGHWLVYWLLNDLLLSEGALNVSVRARSQYLTNWCIVWR